MMQPMSKEQYARDWDKAPVTLEKIDDLVLDWSLYPRKEVDREVVWSYARALQAGCVFPVVKIGLFDGKKIVVDGSHRIDSRVLLKIDYVECASLPFQSEAELFAEAVRLNSDHGKSFTEVEVKANINRLRKLNFNVKDIVAITHVPASEIHRAVASIAVLTGPAGRKIHCDIQNKDCNGHPNTREIIRLKKALQLIRDVAQKGCIPTDEYFRDLVIQCQEALEKVRFNG